MACLLKAQYRWLIGIISPDIRAENGIIRCVSLLSTYCDAAGVDRLQHALEHHRVQQRQGHPGAAQHALEARHPDVQQRQRGFRLDLPHQRGGHQRGHLHLHPPRWRPFSEYCENFPEIALTDQLCQDHIRRRCFLFI